MCAKEANYGLNIAKKNHPGGAFGCSGAEPRTLFNSFNATLKSFWLVSQTHKLPARMNTTTDWTI